MAIYHFSAKTVSRKAGQSAVAKAAYNARDKLTDERTGEVKDYSRKGGLLFSGLYAPKDAPDWARDRAQLWNHAEAAEKRKDSTLAREYQIALPHELTDEQRRYLVQDFVKENFTRKGYAADVNIHAPDRDGDERNTHAHVLVTDRKLDANGFAASKAERQGTPKERAGELEALRESWEKLGNRHMERHGHAPTLDRRTLEAQGIDREPTRHLGPNVAAMQRRGIETTRHHDVKEGENRNQELAQARAELADTTREIAKEHAQAWEPDKGCLPARFKAAAPSPEKETEDERQAKRAGHAAATLYDRAGMTSQQQDALRHHADRQRLAERHRHEHERPQEPHDRAEARRTLTALDRDKARRETTQTDGQREEQQQKRSRRADLPGGQENTETTDAKQAAQDKIARFREMMNESEGHQSSRDDRGDFGRERTRER